MEPTQKHLLVIRLSAMGDVAMSVPVLLALTRAYPKLKITVVSKAFFKPIFEYIPNVHFVAAEVKGKHKGMIGLYKLYKELSAHKVDAVADVHNVLRSKILRFYFSFNNIPIAKINKGRAEKKALTRLKNKKFKQLKTTHERYADVFRKLGYQLQLTNNDVLPKQKITQHIADFIKNDTKPIIGIAPFAAFEGKTYPLALMEKVISALDKTNSYTIVLFGGPQEKEKLQPLTANYANVRNAAGMFSFSEELTLISNLDIMLSMDSGNAHLAAMFGVKVVTIWGVTHPYAGFYPFGQKESYAVLADRKTYPLVPTSVYGNKFPEGYENVMQSITPESIVKKIEYVIDN